MDKISREEWIKILDYGYDIPLWAKIIDLVNKNSVMVKLKNREGECPRYCISVNNTLELKKQLENLV